MYLLVMPRGAVMMITDEVGFCDGALNEDIADISVGFGDGFNVGLFESHGSSVTDYWIYRMIIWWRNWWICLCKLLRNIFFDLDWYFSRHRIL